jgi:acyl-[acyl-carrier-protein]-phospholipid O-acyltransferase/long-chain-fatty-acid--[acyl-carrier-protein] ligase
MSPLISVNVPDREQFGITSIGSRSGTVGQTIPRVAARVVHPETGEPVPYGSEGVLLVQGANRMLGYWNRPEETAAALRDGWYVTGDTAIMNPDGFIRLVDRQAPASTIDSEMTRHARVEERCEAS